MDQETWKAWARAMEALRLRDSAVGSVECLKAELVNSPPGRPWLLEKTSAELSTSEARLVRALRRVRVTPDIPHGLAVLVAAERIERLGVHEWRIRVGKSGGPRISAFTAVSYVQGIDAETSPYAKRMMKGLIAEDAARGLELSTGDGGRLIP